MIERNYKIYMKERNKKEKEEKKRDEKRKRRIGKCEQWRKS